tara:strand:- start:1779 stop:3650 length:1872 start_codon:yes stop_codon:yes gene_type:complete
MIQFQGFKPSGMKKIANAMGFQGNINDFQKFLNDNPDKQTEMMRYQDFAKQMAEGGYIKKMQTGGSIGGITATRVTDPKLPTQAVVAPVGVPQSPDQDIDPTGSQVGTAPMASGVEATTTTATATPQKDITKFEADTKSDEVQATANAITASQVDPSDPRAKVNAAEATKSSVSDLDAAQGTAIKLENPMQREVQKGELVDPVANAEKASKFNEQIQAATATPSEKATVAGQMKTLTEGFDATNPPPWASGALRGVMAQMQARGMGASSLAGQAMVQAALESALPIASADAKTQASFEAQNLSNRQQRAMLAAEHRAKFMGMEFDQAFQARVINASKISDIANMNFNAEQQIALENSRMANTMNLQNLSNRQAMVMAEAAALANMDMANLNNRQQASVMNAQTFLQRDLANMSNKQQVEMFRAQQVIQSLFTDQAAENAARQFNATSQNQVDQFFAQLATQTSQFNAAQANAHAQFNAGETNSLFKFNSEMQNQRDQFNAKNRLIIDQNNAQWRREIATADTAALNRANELNATALLNISNSAYNNLWQYYGDIMDMAWESTENERERVVKMAIAQLNADTNRELGEMKNDYDSSFGFGSLIGTFLTAGKDSILGSFFNLGAA